MTLFLFIFKLELALLKVIIHKIVHKLPNRNDKTKE
jgi:hypothetical protein